MSHIRKVKYAARDNFAGAAALNESIDYIKNKKIAVSGPFDELERVQIAVQTCYELRRGASADWLLSSWKRVSADGVEIGKYLFDNHILENMISHEFRDVYDHIVSIGK